MKWICKKQVEKYVMKKGFLVFKMYNFLIEIFLSWNNNKERDGRLK